MTKADLQTVRDGLLGDCHCEICRVDRALLEHIDTLEERIDKALSIVNRPRNIIATTLLAARLDEIRNALTAKEKEQSRE